MLFNPVDVVVLVIALTGTTYVTYMEMSQQSSVTMVSNGETVPNIDVSCWVPDHFTHSMTDYTNKFCRQVLMKGNPHPVFNDLVPFEDPEKSIEEFSIALQKRLRKYLKGDGNLETIEDSSAHGSEDEKASLKCILFIQIITATVGFIILQQILMTLKSRYTLSQLANPGVQEANMKMDVSEDKVMVQNDTDKTGSKRSALVGLSKSCTGVILYCVIVLILVIVWFVLAVQAQHVAERRENIFAEKSGEDSKIVTSKNETAQEGNLGDQAVDAFLCDFKIRRLGNVQRYTVQCVLSTEITPEEGSTRVIKSAHNRLPAEYNMMLCYTIASVLLVHFLYTLLILPLLNRSYMDILGKQLGNPGKSRFLSDLHLLVMLTDLP